MDQDALRIVPLVPEHAPLCSDLTYPAYRHLLTLEPSERHPGQPAQRPIRALGAVALDAGAVAGLALVEVPTGAPDAELLSLFVVPAWRRQGLGTRLLAELEAPLRNAGATRVAAVYMTGRPEIDAVERMLARRGYSAPEARTVTLRFTPEQALATPWFRRVRLSPDEQVIAWTEVTADERAALRESHLATPWIAAGLEPWRHEAGFDAVSSVALRRGDEVVGWVINHPVSAGVVRFTCSFVRKDLGRRGRILPLYSASIERLRAHGCAACTFVTPVSYRTMVDFVKRRCAPWASFFGETRGCALTL